ncbi:butyrate kinase [Spirochaeta isovalerica]|uniref:Probable butyrate kinase n=1 Tax=Spirochaeta isovalerica TaxID=150 RepID=A0A841RF01_9SPIO|nr:butyrate kinase [Spirochaeta isovalerica]MBB6482186.1 butyrate kinase [Spirochaeta isovalerica]
MKKILAINPGSTSSKIGYFEDRECKSSITIRHDQEEIARYKTIADQYDMRKSAIMDWMSEQKIEVKDLDGVVGRGGLLRPTHGGTFIVNDAIISDLKSAKYGVHASNLGALIAKEIAKMAGVEAYIVDPVTTDEFGPLARYSGHPEIKRVSVFHALNQKASARTVCEKLGKEYEDINMIIAHLGGGATIAAHEKGRAVDVNHGLEEGPFTPERSGGLPVLEIIKMSYSGKFSEDDMKKKVVGRGGLTAYMGTSDVQAIVKSAEDGDEKAREVLEAMIYQISKEIGACATVLKGKVDAIVITGGVAYNSFVTDRIGERVSFIAPLHILPGENELLSMTSGVLRVLEGKEEAGVY